MGHSGVEEHIALSVSAPRDALIADSIQPVQRGLAFGFHRAADTTGALLGVLIALLIVGRMQAHGDQLQEPTFRVAVLISLIPAVLSVLALIVGARDVPVTTRRTAPKFAFRALGKPFMVFMAIVGGWLLYAAIYLGFGLAQAAWRFRPR